MESIINEREAGLVLIWIGIISLICVILTILTVIRNKKKCDIIVTGRVLDLKNIKGKLYPYVEITVGIVKYRFTHNISASEKAYIMEKDIDIWIQSDNPKKGYHILPNDFNIEKRVVIILMALSILMIIPGLYIYY